MSNPFRHPTLIVTSATPATGDGDAPETFAAPVGSRLRWTNRLMLVLLVVIAIVDVGVAFSRLVPGPARWLLLGAPLLVGGLLFGIAWYSRILGYRLEAGELVAIRANRETRIPLAGLVSAEADPEAMAWSIKVVGNDGIGAITGRFRNRRLGAYEALVTDRERAVVLRWPKRCLVVSPDRPEDFVRVIRARAGLPR